MRALIVVVMAGFAGAFLGACSANEEQDPNFVMIRPGAWTADSVPFDGQSYARWSFRGSDGCAVSRYFGKANGDTNHHEMIADRDPALFERCSITIEARKLKGDWDYRYSSPAHSETDRQSMQWACRWSWAGTNNFSTYQMTWLDVNAPAELRDQVCNVPADESEYCFECDDSLKACPDKPRVCKTP